MSLQERYYQEIKNKLQEELQLRSIMAVPRLIKIVVNVGVKEGITDDKVLVAVSEQISIITGQKPNIRRATKAIATFKLRIGDPIGIAVTLRGKKMYAFLERLIAIVLPRVRDFQGVSRNSFDNKGNYTLAVKEQIVFPEIEYDKIDRLRGMEITIVTTAHDAKEGLALLTMMGMPFKK